jgi:hypothetical protein
MPAVAKLARSSAAAILLAALPASAQTPPKAPPLPVLGEPPPDPITLDVTLRTGGAYRFGDGPSFPITSRSGATVGAGITIAPSLRWAVGLAYEHSGLGEEHATGDLGDVEVSRSLDALWASLRLTLFRVDPVAITLTLGPGLVWQHVDADVIAYQTGARPDVFRCQETGGPGLGLRAALGAEVRLAPSLFLSADAVFDNLRLSSDPLGDCAPGAGSATLLGGRAAISYRFDVSRYTR